MKRLILIPLLLLFMQFTFAQTDRQTPVVVPGAGTGSCTCQPNYNVCQATALFMSCCMCCQPGSSCGSWTAFGLAGCRCEGMAKTNPAKFLPNKYNDFMAYLEKNGINSTKLKNYLTPAIAGKVVTKGTSPDLDYVTLDGDTLQGFIDAYVADMKQLSKDPKIAIVLDTYLNKK